MSLLLWVYLYATVAFIVSTYVYFRGIVMRPLPKELEIEHKAVLSLSALAIGAVWVLFIPGLVVHWIVQLIHLFEAHRPRVSLPTPREIRVRS